MNGAHRHGRGLEPPPVAINGDGYVPIDDIHHGGITPLEDATNLDQLFQITEELSRRNFDIEDFAAIAHPGPPRGHDSILKNTLHDLKKDLSTELLTLTSNILARLQTLSRELSSQAAASSELDIHSLLHYDALVKVQQQLEDKSVYICVLGRYNVGKTTLINALLGDEILPVSISPETAVTLYIQHDDIKLEQSTMTTYEPRLIDKTNMTHIVHGKEAVKSHLTSLHRGIRGRSVGRDTNDYLLKVNFPLMKVTSDRSEANPVPYLVDTPGSNEEGEIHLQLLAEQTLHSAAAYIFVMKYDDIKNKEDYNALKMIHQRDPNIFQSERLTIVVTHYDISFQNQQSYMPVKELKKMVAGTIAKAVGIEVSEDIVIPVCGKWASDVRHCATHSAGRQLFNGVQMSLVSVKSTQSDEGPFVIMQQIQTMERDEILEELEKHSMIKELEERISMVSTRLSVVWRNNIVGSCRSFLKLAEKLLDLLLLEVSKEVRDITEQTQHASKVVEHHSTMLKSIKRDSNLLEEFKNAYNRDTDYEIKFSGRVDALLNELKTKLTRKHDMRKYSLEQLTTEINDTFQQHATIEIKRWFLQTKFEKCQRLLHHQTQRVSEKFGRFRAAAALVVEQGGIPQTLEMYLRGDDSEMENNLDEQMELKLSDLSESELGNIIKNTYKFRLKIPFIRANVLSGTVDELIADRREAILKSHREFFAVVKDMVVLHFFKTYCTVVIKELGIFMRILNDNGEIHKLKTLLERKQLINPNIQRRNEYEELKQHMSQLATHLDVASRHGNI